MWSFWHTIKECRNQDTTCTEKEETRVQEEKNKYSATTKKFNLSVIYICNVVEPNPMKNCTLCWHPIDGQLDHQIFVWHQSLVCILAIAIFKQSQVKLVGRRENFLFHKMCWVPRFVVKWEIHSFPNSANWNKFIHNFISSYSLHRRVSNTQT